MIRIIQFILLLPILSISQIQINEIFADNGSCCLDDSLETEDFIEIINMGQAPIDVAGYFFGDGNSGSIIPSGFPELTTINGGGLLLLWFDEDPEQGPLHIDAGSRQCACILYALLCLLLLLLHDLWQPI